MGLEGEEEWENVEYDRREEGGQENKKWWWRDEVKKRKGETKKNKMKRQVTQEKGMIDLKHRVHETQDTRWCIRMAADATKIVEDK